MSSKNSGDGKEPPPPQIPPRFVFSGEGEERQNLFEARSAALQDGQRMEIATSEWAIRPSTSSVFENTSAQNVIPTTFGSQFLSSPGTIEPCYQLMDSGSNTSGQYGCSAFDQPTSGFADDYTTSNLTRADKFRNFLNRMRDYDTSCRPFAQSGESSGFRGAYHQTGYPGPSGPSASFGGGFPYFGCYAGASDSTTSIYSVGGFEAQRADYLSQHRSSTITSAQAERPLEQLRASETCHQTGFPEPSSSITPFEYYPGASDSTTPMGRFKAQSADYLLRHPPSNTSSVQAVGLSEQQPGGSRGASESYYHQTGYPGPRGPSAPFGGSSSDFGSFGYYSGGSDYLFQPFSSTAPSAQPERQLPTSESSYYRQTGSSGLSAQLPFVGDPFDFESLRHYPGASDPTTSIHSVGGLNQRANYLLQPLSSTISSAQAEECSEQLPGGLSGFAGTLKAQRAGYLLQTCNTSSAGAETPCTCEDNQAPSMEPLTQPEDVISSLWDSPSSFLQHSKIAQAIPSVKREMLEIVAESMEEALTKRFKEIAKSVGLPPCSDEDRSITEEESHCTTCLLTSCTCSVPSSCGNIIRGVSDEDLVISPEHYEAVHRAKEIRRQNPPSVSEDEREDQIIFIKTEDVETLSASDDAVASVSSESWENRNPLPPSPKFVWNLYDAQATVHHEGTVADLELVRGKFARPGWMGGSFLITSWEHEALAAKPTYKLQKSGIDGFNYIKTTEASLKIFQEESVITIKDGLPDCRLRDPHSYLKRQIAVSTESVLNNDTQAAYFRDIWKLCWALFGPLQNKNSELDKWLKEVIAPIIEREESVSQHVLDMTYLNLTGGRVKQAVELTAKNKYPHLSLLISSSTTKRRHLLFEQMKDWSDSGAIRFINEKVLRVYMLLSGSVVCEGLNICRDLDWLRAFAIHLWYGPQPLSITVSLYEKGFRQLGYAPTPSPPYYTGSSENAPLDIMYHLIILFTNKQYMLNHVLNPATYTSDINDYSLSWFLVKYFQEIQVGIITNNAEDYIGINFAEQLEHKNLWHYSIFVLLSIKNVSTKKKLIMEVLYRNLTEDIFSPEKEAIKLYLTQDLQLPWDWIYSVLVEKCKLKEDYNGAYHYYLHLDQLNEAQDIALTYLIPDLIKNDHYSVVIEFMKELEPHASRIDNWNNKLGLLLDMFTTLDLVFKNLHAPEAQMKQFYDRLLLLCKRTADFEIQNAGYNFCITLLSEICVVGLISIIEKLPAIGEMDKLYLMQVINELRMPPNSKSNLIERLTDVDICAKRRRSNEE